MIKDKILKNLKEVLNKLNIKDVDVSLEKPANSDFGDYSTSLPLKLTKQLKKSPMIIADEIVKNFPKNENIQKIEIVKPGFINFWISTVQSINRLTEILEKGFTFPEYHLGKNKKVMVEFAHPNTHKLFHIGHLRNISTGESVVRILEAVGNKVIRSNYEGDVGLHIAKCLFGIKNSKTDIKKLKTLQEEIEFIGKMYSTGTKAYEDDEKSKQEIIKINKMIYDRDPKIMPLWTETRQWSLEYFDQNYKRFYSHFDRLYFESEIHESGLEISKEILKKGILENSQGAVVFNGKKYGLDIRVFINSLGYPTYEGKELALAEKEFSDFGELDKIIHTVTPEQTSFFKVTFKVEELIDEKKYKNKQYHLAYEWVKLKAGKMSSREGNIIEANWLIDEVKKKILEKSKCDEETAETLAVASVKYSFLKNGTQTIIHFDIDESIAVDGNSAPYLIYTYVRCQSVLKKAKNYLTRTYDIDKSNLNFDELNVLRLINQFPEIVQKAAIQLSPNIIANYLYELAQKYNYFYQKNKILESKEKIKQFRLMLTQATGKVIKEGLYLLGIKTVEQM
ncbi:arginine--tRNA ligase [Candidatus Roizmanbacteria bacterium CG06_land_8_20_14_3_00_34_14]|uniref:Arginine--tRNA ligase n=2 Tax=Candidatus Roizmaniibacteriota TaxID=1752723 RepID=A0A2M7AU66_9BACT|nr:MAG: arginine--tRNA ligase [Candidatus Roizmanbacteria bacterium CG07_land_8_20_14_0_80_34_15]PIU74174.1 MAG: arginine--tRNA ligase [Candidatus Roizmanbacteria bacterium CG06_land_8_20_14_3_00_34_14]